ncbi:hypothetical protein [Microbacterium sulfonylureivorans]|uniref:hypothetical protein n=1 Tax=Microbacterium sulfonylureivorans TaxID=2486854 RepID=UPI000FD96099|nr:hypothetical protein [Microbacterium sulfonylureivorans]
MVWFYAQMFGWLLLGVVLGVTWRLARGRRYALAGGVVAACTGLAVVPVILVEVLPDLLLMAPINQSPTAVVWYLDNRYLLTILAGILGVALLALPVRRRSSGGSADLAPRSLGTFTDSRRFIAPIIFIAIILIITLTTGALSEADPQTGRYDQIMVDGGVMAIGTTIYGWFYSVPALIALFGLIAVAAIVLSLIARPAFMEDRETDVRIRWIRSRNVVTAVTATLVLHLGMLFTSLSATASVTGTFATPDGQVSMWSPIAAFGPVFTIAAYFSGIAGVALWTTVALTAIPARRPALVAVPT